MIENGFGAVYFLEGLIGALANQFIPYWREWRKRHDVPQSSTRRGGKPKDTGGHQRPQRDKREIFGRLAMSAAYVLIGGGIGWGVGRGTGLDVLAIGSGAGWPETLEALQTARQLVKSIWKNYNNHKHGDHAVGNGANSNNLGNSGG